MPPIRLVHFSDLHVGMENYGKLDPATGTSSRTRDFLDRLDEVIDYAFAHKADLAVFTGDAFKTRDPEPTQQREFARRIKRLAEKIPTLLLVGNHDLPGTVARATSLDIYHVLEIPNVIVGYKPGSQLIQTASGPVFLAWMPYPSRNRLLVDEDHKGKSLPELEQALRDVVTGMIRDLSEQAAGQDAPRILAGHFTVSGAVFGSERSVMLGSDVAVTKSAAAGSAWDYVALGHIHKFQNLTKGEEGSPPVVYAGSLERIDFGEEDEDEGIRFRGNFPREGGCGIRPRPCAAVPHHPGRRKNRVSAHPGGPRGARAAQTGSGRCGRARDRLDDRRAGRACSTSAPSRRRPRGRRISPSSRKCARKPAPGSEPTAPKPLAARIAGPLPARQGGG